MADPVAGIARAILYEGFALYPYRASALKNRSRLFFGGVYPPAWSAANPGDRDSVGAQMLLRGYDFTLVHVSVRFLQFDATGGASERCVELNDSALGELANHPRSIAFDVGSVTVSATPINDAFRIDLSVRNTSTCEVFSRDEALLATMASLHVVLRVTDGEWISLLEPPQEHAADANACKQLGLYPVLVGREGTYDTMLASPIALYDYPRIAPESPGDLFDGTEIDEMLTLRLQTLADSEIAELAAAEPRVRELLERAQAIEPRRMEALHGSLRTIQLAKGARVRIKPRPGKDAFDLVLAGRVATVISVEHDFDGATHIAVVLDDDPGADLGEAGFHGHRFFFAPGEVEAL